MNSLGCRVRSAAWVARGSSGLFKAGDTGSLSLDVLAMPLRQNNICRSLRHNAQHTKELRKELRL